MTKEQKTRITKLALDISINGSFAMQNAEAGHEKAAEKYDNRRVQAYDELIAYLDSISTTSDEPATGPPIR